MAIVTYFLSKARRFLPRLFTVDAEDQEESVWSADWQILHCGEREGAGSVQNVEGQSTLIGQLVFASVELLDGRPIAARKFVVKELRHHLSLSNKGRPHDYDSVLFLDNISTS